MSSPIRGGSPVRGSYDDVRALSEGEKEEEGVVDVQNEPLPPIFQLPPEILALIFNYAAGSDRPGDAKTLCAIRSVCCAFNRLSDDVLRMYWTQLGNGRVPVFHSLVTAIERRIGDRDFSYFFRFHVLTEGVRQMEVSVPDEDPDTAIQPLLGVQPLQYVQALLDVSLEAIWPKIRDQIDFGQDLVPDHAAAIRLWLNDPAHTGRLAPITDLDLSGLGLRMLPSEIGNLTQLRSLSLDDNQLVNLPPQIGNLTQLQKLSLDDNQLVNLPPQIGKLTQLQKLSLNDNQLVTLPPQIGNLTQLQRLSLNENQLVNLPPQIGNLTQLQWLYLKNNQLVNLPSEICNLTQLQKLFLKNNQLVNLPPQICKLTRLRDLSLDGNQLVNLPPQIGNLTQLKWLALNGNQLVNLPPQIGNLTQLLGLYLNGNQLVNLPPQIGNLTRLQALYLKNNQLVNLPPQVGKLTQLQWLSLSDNQLVNLSSQIGNLTRLLGLYLDRNQLVNLPPQIGNLTQLQEFYLNGNPLMFSFNRDLSEIDRDEYLNAETVARYVARYAACSEYPCQSSFAALCQAIHRGVDNETLRERFEALSLGMQESIRNKWEVTPSSSSSSSQVDGDLFADRVLFAKAVISALREKFNGLSEEKRGLTYRRVAELAGHPAPDSSWGEEYYAEDNIIRLIDAMELMSN